MGALDDAARQALAEVGVLQATADRAWFHREALRLERLADSLDQAHPPNGAAARIEYHAAITERREQAGRYRRAADLWDRLINAATQQQEEGG